MNYLDFGSGNNPRPGFQTCDFTGFPNLDYLFDDKEYRIIGMEDNSIDFIRCKNVIHHIKDLNRLFLEFKRVLKINGRLLVIDSNKETYIINKIMDLIWYRFVVPRYDIWFSSEYRDYFSLLPQYGFKLETKIKSKYLEYSFHRKVRI